MKILLYKVGIRNFFNKIFGLPSSNFSNSQKANFIGLKQGQFWNPYMCTSHLAYFKSGCKFMRVRPHQGRTVKCYLVLWNYQGISDRRSFNPRSRSFFCNRDCDRRLPFGQKIAGQSRSLNSMIAIFLAFFKQSTFCRSNIWKLPEIKEWKFRKKAFGCIKQMIMNKLAYETCEK